MFTIRRAVPSDAAPLAALGARTFSDTFAAHNTVEDLAAYLAQTYGEAQQRQEIEDLNGITLLGEECSLPMTSPESVVFAKEEQKVRLGEGWANRSRPCRPIAFAQLRLGEAPACVEGARPVELARFYVDRGFHGRGIAQQLMEAVRNAARNLGGETLWLGVWEHNPRAIRFYEKCGFEDVGSHGFFVGSDLQTDRVMVDRR
ncbi:MAG: GNAT family N-acetyltransferase [Acidobacteria bacterium]|nr:GNAT family N-acetyltransferase [Acidobacteriota bacterium]